jgi:hypothetical protein
MLDTVERDLNTGRAAIAQTKSGSMQWLARWGAGSGVAHTTVSVAGELSARLTRQRIKTLVQESNARRRTGEDTHSAIDALAAAIAEANAVGELAHCFLVHAWQGESAGAYRAYARDLRKPRPSSTYVVVGSESHLFLFETDKLGRTCSASTTLDELDQPRAPVLQSAARRAKEGDTDDDGGHLIPHQFGGPREEINIVPQDWFENRRGTWRTLEKQWRGLFEKGEEVWIDVEPVHIGSGARPVSLNVRWARRTDVETPWVEYLQKIDNAHRHGSRTHDSSA